MKQIEPKLEFLKTPQAAELSEVLNTPLMRSAIRIALEQFVEDLPRHDDFNGATKAQYELQGARRYIFTLLNLTEPEETPKATPQGVLQWQRKPSQHQQAQPQPRQQQPKQK